jgi:signal transduction histidine kinase
MDALPRAIWRLPPVRADRALDGFAGRAMLPPPTESRLLDETRAEMARLAALVDHLDAGVLLVDLDARVVLVNRPCRELLGYAPTRGMRLDALGVTFEAVGAAGVALAVSPFDRLLAGAEFSDCEVLLVRADGARRRISMSGTILRDAAGAPSAMMGLMRDVSALRATEEMREEYLALLSHDLRSPLSGVTLFSSLLERVLSAKGLSAEAANAHRILKSARQLGALIQELLESTRLESDHAPLHKTMVDVRELVRDTCIALSPPDEDRIVVDCAGSMALFADEPRLKRALTNLVSNALKYSPPHKPVKVTCQMTDRELNVAVTDEGPGISPQHLPHLFQKYYRAGQSGRRDSIGLGLYIVRLIVERHAGRVWVETNPGHGTTFRFNLPVERHAETAELADAS